MPYTPSHFAATDEAARSLISANPFATLITVHDGEVFATQIPLIFKDAHTLIGHMARANPHSVMLCAASAPIAVTAQFTGVNAYISPAWYAINTGVPTWNYETVQVRGQLTPLTGAAPTEAVVKALIDAFDTQPQVVKQAWADSAPKAQAAQLGAIVAFEIAISELHAKTKLSQNRTLADRQAVVHALQAGSANDGLMAAAMAMAKQYAEQYAE